jgi:phosphopantetheinyl transferase (holo-ACP synthase)
VGALTDLLAARGIQSLHGSVSHDGDMAVAVVILEGRSG